MNAQIDTAQVTKPLIEFTGVQKSYDGKHLIIKDLNLNIGRGEFLTLLGASGYGQDHDPDDARRLRNPDPW